MASVIRVLAMLTLVSVALTACGKRGVLEAPDAAEERPAASGSAKASGGAGSGGGGGGGSGEKKKADEQRTFVLDPLLR
jgi:predicted small lipoprotein YifL